MNDVSSPRLQSVREIVKSIDIHAHNKTLTHSTVIIAALLNPVRVRFFYEKKSSTRLMLCGWKKDGRKLKIIKPLQLTERFAYSNFDIEVVLFLLQLLQQKTKSYKFDDRCESMGFN